MSAFNRSVEVSVGKNDGWALAAQLQGDLLDVASRGPLDDPSHLGGAGERDLKQVLGQCLAVVTLLPISCKSVPSVPARVEEPVCPVRQFSSAGCPCLLMPVRNPPQAENTTNNN